MERSCSAIASARAGLVVVVAAAIAVLRAAATVVVVVARARALAARAFVVAGLVAVVAAALVPLALSLVLTLVLVLVGHVFSPCFFAIRRPALESASLRGAKVRQALFKTTSSAAASRGGRGIFFRAWHGNVGDRTNGSI